MLQTRLEGASTFCVLGNCGRSAPMERMAEGATCNRAPLNPVNVSKVESTPLTWYLWTPLTLRCVEYCPRWWVFSICRYACLQQRSKSVLTTCD